MIITQDITQQDILTNLAHLNTAHDAFLNASARYAFTEAQQHWIDYGVLAGWFVENGIALCCDANGYKLDARERGDA